MKRELCLVDNCSHKRVYKSLCNMHYKRLRRNGNYERVVGFTKSNPYMQIARFGGMREFVIQRDEEKCVQCGMTRIQHRHEFQKDITVDHIDGQGRYSKVPNNDPDNLQTLCFRCHGKKDGLQKGHPYYHLN